jgi:lipoprotein NlpI
MAAVIQIRQLNHRTAASRILLSWSVVFGVIFLVMSPAASAVVPQRILGDAQPIGATIASFDKYIGSGRLQGKALAQRYWERGIQYGKLGHYDKAVEDYTSAINLDSQLVSAYIDRAVGFARMEKYKQAYADLNTVLQLQPKNTRAYVTRGTLSFLVGKYEFAAADFKRYLQLNPNDIYRMLWLYLSEKYHNRNAITDVSKFSATANLVEWPGAILKLYMGEVDAEAVIEALSKGVPNMQIGHACEAYYYLGQYYLLQNDRRKALELFNKAVATQAKAFVEYEFALAYSIKLRN